MPVFQLLTIDEDADELAYFGQASKTTHKDLKEDYVDAVAHATGNWRRTS